MSSLRPRSIAAALAAVLLGGALRVSAQDVTEVRLKGAFIFNFARFTDWPPEALSSSSTVSACIVGDKPISDALQSAVSGQRLSGRPVVVSLIDPKTTPTNCHLLYVSGVDRVRLSELIVRLREAPVLTVSDDDGFLKAGGMIQIFIESGKMRFRINPRAAKRAHLQLSSRLLALAELVDVEPPPVLAAPTGPAR